MLRSVVVFVALLAVLRLTGKRQVGQLAHNDLVLLLILSNAVQNWTTRGLISALTLVGMNYLFSRLVVKNRKVERFLDGRPQILVRDSVLLAGVMSEAGITRDELNGVLRKMAVAT